MRCDDSLNRLTSTCTVLGLFEDWQCGVAETVLAPGDTLMVYTDGISEAFDDRAEEFGEARLVESLRRHRELSPKALLDAVLDDVRRFSPQEQRDDMTLLVARCV